MIDYKNYKADQEAAKYAMRMIIEGLCIGSTAVIGYFILVGVFTL